VLQLHPSLSYCDVSDRHVFLDLPGDRYFCLDGELDADWRAALRGQATLVQTDRLIARGIVVRAGGTQLAPCPAEIPKLSALDSDATSRSWARAVGGTLGAAWLRRRLQRERLEQVINAFVEAKAGGGRGHRSSADIADIAADFSRLDLFLTTLHQCLSRSLAVGFHLAHRGYRPDLVLAVRLGPFHAHCWIECDGMLVNDRYERVRDFQPIRRL
jgi:hypothetical protein